MAERPRRGLRETLRKRWRAWLRAIHRDVGYFIIGLTVIYAVSGIAINHVGDWDPNFKSVVDSYQLDKPLSEDEDALTTLVAKKIGASADDIQASYFDTDTVFEVAMGERTARLDTTTGVVKVASKEPRFILRVANWLHYNRGKEAWTYVADGFSFLLLYLALSGAFMLKGRKGLIGRGGVLILIGVAVPIVYVQLSGGP